MMDVFYTTVAIVFGILSPIIIVAVIVAVVIIGRSIPEMLRLKVEELKKLPPFDEVEVSHDMARNTAIARFIKNGEIVWQGDVIEAIDGR